MYHNIHTTRKSFIATLKTHTEQDWWANPSGYNNLYSLFWNGNYAVTVFFLLSGRVITLSVLKKGFCIER